MKVSLKDDSLPEGTELHVPNLGTLVNGQSVDLDEDAIKVFEFERGVSLEEAFANDPRVMVGKASKLPPAEKAEEEEVKGGESD